MGNRLQRNFEWTLWLKSIFQNESERKYYQLQMMVDQQVKSSLLPFDAGEALKAKTIKEAGLRVSTGVHWSKSREKRFSSIKNLIAINLQAHVLGSIKTLNVRDCLLALAFCWLSINTLFMAGKDWLAPRNEGMSACYFVSFVCLPKARQVLHLTWKASGSWKLTN